MKKNFLTLGFVVAALFSSVTYSHSEHASAASFARFEYQGATAFGQVTGNRIQPLVGDLFGEKTPNGPSIPLSDVELVLPTNPQKVFAVGMNFASHLSSATDAPPPMFLKLPTSLIVSGKNVELPKDATNVHFEGELVLVIGKQAKHISEEQAHDVIFGVTVGNDLTDRRWQGTDLQWLRSKASDGFGPISPLVATGVDYNNVLLTTRLNGDVVQQENTKNMIHKPAKVVSYLSRYFTLMPGDLIFMGTPGRTQALDDGDLVSVEIEQVGVVQNKIRQR